MLSDQQLNGSYLPKGTLCLTFDDGPGPDTLKIAFYLSDNGIKGTFFMLGRQVEQFSDYLPKIQMLGHLIANHGYNHLDITMNNVIDQIVRTDNIIKKYIHEPKIYFRAPCGNWLPEFAIKFNQDSGITSNYCGPINWTFMDSPTVGWTQGDWHQWDENIDPSRCAQIYLDGINQAQCGGIVLMHDYSSAELEIERKKNRAFEFIKELIPKLKESKYQFMRLDEVY